MNRLSFFCLLLAALAPVGTAGLIVIGTADPGSGNSFPFGVPAGAGTVYQEVYAPGDFTSTGPIDITSVHFYRTQFGSATDTITDATYTVKLSYSNFAVNALDTSTLANNVGAGQVTLGTYVITNANDLVGSGLDFEENVSDFNYDPANGALLLEIDLSSIGTRGTSFLDAMNGDAGGVLSRAHNFDGGYADFGLVTGFDYGGVPEPATIGLIGSGLLALAFLRRRL